MKQRLTALVLVLGFGISGPLLADEKAEVTPLGEEAVETDASPDEEAFAPMTDDTSGTEQLEVEVIEKSGDVLEMPPATAGPPPPLAMPYHGMKMFEVENRYGTPQARHPAVGDPPITRWDYDGFSVFFEHSTVLHSVQQGRPAEIYRKDELLPATSP